EMKLCSVLRAALWSNSRIPIGAPDVGTSLRTHPHSLGRVALPPQAMAAILRHLGTARHRILMVQAHTLRRVGTGSLRRPVAMGSSPDNPDSTRPQPIRRRRVIRPMAIRNSRPRRKSAEPG